MDRWDGYGPRDDYGPSQRIVHVFVTCTKLLARFVLGVIHILNFSLKLLQVDGIKFFQTGLELIKAVLKVISVSLKLVQAAIGIILAFVIQLQVGIKEIYTFLINLNQKRVVTVFSKIIEITVDVLQFILLWCVICFAAMLAFFLLAVK